jgi:rfaE bifunctional protein nucleotidyltransferase chain/domain
VVLVSDYGRGITAAPDVRRAVGRAGTVVWDPHPRGSEPIAGAALVTPNLREARAMTGTAGGAADLARMLVPRLSADAVAVTAGREGAHYADRTGESLRVPGPAVQAADAVGAGDRLAARAASALCRGAGALEALRAGVDAASRHVAGGGSAGEVVRRARASGGRVIATGGCFDLLHAGHLSLLEGARALGDHLIVLVNSDESVRRLKGPGRPLVHEDERRRLLEALRCVDAVELFEEDTPAAALERLRPDVFVKGADYAAHELPEAALMRRIGGEVRILPYVAGRSTTRLIEEAAHRVAR